jgi:hypothetical protein
METTHGVRGHPSKRAQGRAPQDEAEHIVVMAGRRPGHPRNEREPMKTPGGWDDPNRRALLVPLSRALEHAEDDCADKGECDIRGNNAQSVHEGTPEGHRESPCFVAPRCNARNNNPFPAE